MFISRPHSQPQKFARLNGSRLCCSRSRLLPFQVAPALGVAALTVFALGWIGAAAFGPTAPAPGCSRSRCCSVNGVRSYIGSLQRLQPLQVERSNGGTIPLLVLCQLYCCQVALRCRLLDLLITAPCALCLHQSGCGRRTSWALT